MAIDLNDEILQDFLVEAGEILELLGEQLVTLEQTPEDYDLLNAIFRGFHTIKGGAGFLAIEPLVNVCHKAEDVFNVLRQGERVISPDLMDVVLAVTDVLNVMFDNIKTGEDPHSAESSLLSKLAFFAQPNASLDVVQEQPKVIVDTAKTVAENSIEEDSVEIEFEAMLEDALDESVESTGKNDDITEQEFDQLLDELHGSGGSPTLGKNQQKVGGGDEITEAEFDEVLDQLYGEGNFGKVESKQDSASVSASNSSTSQDKKPSPGIESKATNSSISAEKTNSAINQKSSVTPIKQAKAAKPVAKQTGDTSVRVDTQVLDDIMNMVGELVLVRNRFKTLRAAPDSESNAEDITKTIANLDIVTADLQLAVMKTRMQPIKKVFGRFPRVVRDLAKSLNKEIKLELKGEDTDLDKNLVEALSDPLVHLVRNAVDHGVETPEEREKAGKKREGLVVLNASQEGDHIQLTIEDDGKGMNADVLREKAVEKGLMDEETAARLDSKECYNLIFMPGFSTKTEISDVSGRGVGMDVVKTRINQMNGTVEVDSKLGQGSKIIIKVPLTLAILPTLMVKLAQQPFALPLSNVMEILDLDLKQTNKVDNQLVIMVRGKALPLFFLSEWLVSDPDYNNDTNQNRMAHVVIVNVGGRQLGLVVDHLVGQEEVVIKALGKELVGIGGLAGGTITGDGKIALILDLPGLIKKYAA
ncbi:MAG: chemotaxis protein CheA [Methylococcaceae bacterium]